MILGRVVGTVVATRKDEKLVGAKLLVVRPVDPHGKDEPGYVVAVDTVTDDLVLTDREAVAHYRDLYERIKATCLPADQSLRFLTEAAREIAESTGCAA